MTEREKFEAWCAKRYKNCAYLHTSSTCGDWDAWQAAIASRAPMPLEKAEALAHRTASRYTHKSERSFTAYTFLPHTLEDFVLKVERFHETGE